ncbi:MAG: hypothetical protein OHK0029_19340 [Armatimonadaceae bacterium]
MPLTSLKEEATPFYTELIDFIIAENPERYAHFQTSEKVRERVWDLVHREKTSGLTEKEKAELDTYAQLEHIMRLAKAKARLNIAQQSKNQSSPE